jgi:hypothetical protein
MDAAKGRLDGAWHDVKVGVVYTARPDQDGVDTLAERGYVARQENSQGKRWAKERIHSLKEHGPAPRLRSLARRKPSSEGLSDLPPARDDDWQRAGGSGVQGGGGAADETAGEALE